MAPVKERRDYLVGTLLWGGVALTGLAGWYGLVWMAKVALVLASWYL